MENFIKLFESEKFGKVRMVKVDGKPYAVAKDVALALGYKNTNDAILKHCKGVAKHDILTNGGIQHLSLITQGDIIRLSVKCKLPGAEEFESWIFDTVIPSVLNNGAYIEDATEEETKKIVDQFRASKYLTEEIHDRSSLRKFIREYDKMKLDECIDTIAEITIKVKGKIKHQLLDVAIKEFTTIDNTLLRDTIKHTYIKDTIAEGIIRLQDIKIGKLKRRVSRLEQVG